MNVTDVRIRLIRKEIPTALKAVATITLDDVLVIHDIKIIEGKKGIFMAFPSNKVGEEFKDIVHPIQTELRMMIQSKVIATYYDEVNKPVEEKAEEKPAATE